MDASGRAAWAGLVVMGVCVVACGPMPGGSGRPPRGDVDDPIATVAAPLFSTNTVSYGGGGVLANVRVVPVFWGSGVAASTQTEIHCMYTSAVMGPYIDALSEYDTPTQHIGRGTVAANVTISPANTSSTLTDAAIQSELAARIGSGALPTPSSDTLFMIHFPPGISITNAQGTSCTKFGFCGYHASFLLNNRSVRYAVLPDHGQSSPCATLCGPTSIPFESLEKTASQQLMDAITDPDPNNGWIGGQGEIGEPCKGEVTIPGTNYAVVHQLWSNTQNICATSPSGLSATEPPIIRPGQTLTGLFSAATPASLAGSCFANASVTTNVSLPLQTLRQSFDFIDFTVPPSRAGEFGPATLFINNSDGSGPAVVTFEYLPDPAIPISVSPATGPMQGGTAVTIAAANMTSAGFPAGPFANLIIAFGDATTPATRVQCSHTTCTASTPAHDPGTVDVILSAGPVSRTLPQAFTFTGPRITDVSPRSGPITGGTVVRVHAVDIADVSQSVFDVSALFGGISINNVSCRRVQLNEADCDVTSPAVAQVPTSPDGITPLPVDIQLQVPHSPMPLTTPTGAVDGFTYEQEAKLSSFAFVSAIGVGGTSVNARLTLNGNAPAGDAVITLALDPGSPSGVLDVPPTVRVTAGQTETLVPIDVIGQNYAGPVSVVASYVGATGPATSLSATLWVVPTPPPTLGQVGPICAGQSATLAVTLSEPVPPGGGSVTLTSDSAALTVPSSIPLSPGTTDVAVPIVAGFPAAVETAHVSVSYFGIVVDTSVDVLSASTVFLRLPSLVEGGTVATGQLSLCTPGTFPLTSVAVTSDSPQATPPAFVVFAPRQSVAPLPVPTSPTASRISATITATLGSYSTSAVLHIMPPPAPRHCVSGKLPCTCPDGTSTCVTSARQCVAFCL